MNNFTGSDAIALSVGLKKISIDELKKSLDLPSDALFCGYLVHVEDKDEFLAFIEETDLATKRAFVRNPEDAQMFDEFGDAFKVARKEKNEIVVGLFDLGKQLYVFPIL